MKKKCLIRFAYIIVLCCVMLFLNGCNKVEQRDIYVPSIDSITEIKVGNEASNFEIYKSLSKSENIRYRRFAKKTKYLGR